MLDIFLLVVLVWALFSGWRNGLIRELASMIGVSAGLLIATSCYASFGRFLSVDGSEVNMTTSIIAFLLLWIAVPLVLGMFATMLTRFVRAIALGPINSTLGAIFALVKFSLLIGCALTVMSNLGILNTQRVTDSKLYAPLSVVFQSAYQSYQSYKGEDEDDDEQDEHKDQSLMPRLFGQPKATQQGDTVWIERKAQR